MFKRAALFCLVILVSLSGCTFQKRMHRNGYYVRLGHSKTNKETQYHKQKKQAAYKPDHQQTKETGIASETPEEPLLASNSNILFLAKKKITKDSVKSIECGDSIWFKGGTASLVKVVEINTNEIKYKRCDNMDGPVIFVSRSSVAKIKYANGLTESYGEVKKKEVTVIPQPEPVVQKPTNTLAKIAFICGMVFLACGLLTLLAFLAGTEFVIFFMVLGGISYFATWATSIAALISIKARPEKHSGKGLAWGAFAIVAGYSILVLAILFLLLYGI